jgi:hypothetical protein
VRLELVKMTEDARLTMRTRDESKLKLKGHPARKNDRAFEDRPRLDGAPQSRDEREAKRRAGHVSPSNAALGAEFEREPNRPPRAVLIRWVVAGVFVGSVSVWAINVTQPPPPGRFDNEAIPAPGPNPAALVNNAAVPDGPGREGAPWVNQNGEQCRDCFETSNLAVGRLTKEAELLSSVGSKSLEPKETFKDCSKCPEMIVVPGGRFTMGSPDTERGHNPDEGPPHAVTFSLPFAVGRFDVRGAGCVRGRRRLQWIYAARSGLGSRTAAGDERVLGRCPSLCGMGLVEDRLALPSSQRS